MFPSRLDSSLSQLISTLTLIKALKASEFPYEAPKLGLQIIEDHFERYRIRLEAATHQGDERERASAVDTASEAVRNSIDILGFLLRSTNIRNAFEMHGPFLRLTKKIFAKVFKRKEQAVSRPGEISKEDADIHLVLSSEWSFSPSSIVGYAHLPSFVMIGMSAIESHNPFVLPLAGHELGHAIWPASRMNTYYSALVDSAVIAAMKTTYFEQYEEVFREQADFFKKTDPVILMTDIAIRPTWAQAALWCRKQIEEIFCDLLAAIIFGESYLHAFAYLLAPSYGRKGIRKSTRSCAYPNNVERAKAIASVVQENTGNRDDQFVTEYVGLFEDSNDPPEQFKEARFQLLVADTVRRSLFGMIKQHARDLVSQAGLGVHSQDSVQHCLECFRKAVPAETAGSLANILNAGWIAMLHPGKFFIESRYENDKQANLREIILKSIEILDVEEKLAGKFDYVVKN